MSNSHSEYVLPFGKYEGRSIEEVPSGYLRWLIQTLDDEEIVEAAENEFRFRTYHSCHFYD